MKKTKVYLVTFFLNICDSIKRIIEKSEENISDISDVLQKKKNPPEIIVNQRAKKEDISIFLSSHLKSKGWFLEPRSIIDTPLSF